MKLFGWFKRRSKNHTIDPDQVFLDAQNLPRFNTQQFEGVLERPLTQRTFWIAGVIFFVIGVVFIGRLGFLQLSEGEAYFAHSETNRLVSQTIFSKRGVIQSKKGTNLAWNVNKNDEPFARRAYTDRSGFSHVLGYVNYPKKDSSGLFWRKQVVGVQGVEKKFNATLSGEPGSKLVEVNATQEVVSSGNVQPPKSGDQVTLTIDSGLQHAMHQSIASMSTQFGYEGGTGVIMNINNGNVLTLTNYPEYNAEAFSAGNTKKIQQLFKDPSTPFLNRAVKGLYTPGSIIKPFVALGALNEGLITPETTINSTGYIEIENPYDPGNPYRFYDWRWEKYGTGHGVTDVYHAIADSVNTYFYAIGGGYKDQKGLGIDRIEKYMRKFDVAEPTGFIFGGQKEGVIPTPEWKENTFKDGNWRLGDTYNTVIGQYGFQVTPMQMVKAVAGLANDGTLVTPRLIKNTKIKKRSIQGIEERWYSVIRDAMRQTVTDGTGKVLDLSYVKPAVKTGTAQTKGNEKINAWTIGFFPYENPQYVFVVLGEEGPADREIPGSYWAMREVFTWMKENRPGYLPMVKSDN